MSHPARPSNASQPTVASRMLPPVRVTGPTQVFPHPNAYGLVTPQPHPFIPHPVYTPSLRNMPPGVSMVMPSSIPGMYVPVAQVNTGMHPANVDPTKLLEEQRKFEKERNFQMQQQRLKQFTVAGKKGNLNAENLIDNMFGKMPQKQSQKSQVTSTLKNTDLSSTSKPSRPAPETSKILQIQPKQEIQLPAPMKREKIDKKELDAMMQECSNLSGPQKANKFSKPSVKELTPSAQQRYTFTASNKARDWKNLQGLDEVFIAKRPRFPGWCSKEHIPEIYKQIEAIVTSNETHAPDTQLLFPILLSSGLPQQYLGQIWELVNQSAPGQLTIEEMYAALALIAVTQAGHPVKSVDILHQLPACPIPQLQCFANPPQSVSVETQSTNLSTSVLDDKNSQSPLATNEISETVSHQVLRPSAISLKNIKNVPGNLNISQGSGFISSPDDEFDDFKSATPTAVNFHMDTPSSDSIAGGDDFDEFKQAPISNFTDSKVLLNFPSTKEVAVPDLPITNNLVSSSVSKPPLAEQDLLSPEDKYSAFRTLQQTEVENEWSDFSSGVPAFVSTNRSEHLGSEDPSQSDETVVTSEFLSNPSVLFTQTNQIGGLFRTNPSTVNPPKEDDEFGDFLAAEVPAPTVASVTSQLAGLSTNFADFTNFREPEFHQVPPAAPRDSLQTDEEFGDFASSIPPPSKPELGHEFLFHHLKDNVSLAESQSVSSLELGTFDGGGHSGDSKSSLSRQGSIPSLDLKSVYLEGADTEDFGEFQSQPVVVSRASKSPSPATDIKGTDCNYSSNTPSAIPFQTTGTVPLIDKYSVIRLEERKEEDQHISCWMRCLQSSVNILQNTKKIFNQMSCSSVCNEVLRSEEGENYIKDVIEVFKVVRRIATASKSASKQTIPMLDLLNEANQAWNTICGFFAGSNLMPEESSFEFSNAVLKSNTDDNTKACGLCLLNIEIRSKSDNAEERIKLSYGGRNYHSTCANLWVNCVDPLLPALTLPLLL